MQLGLESAHLTAQPTPGTYFLPPPPTLIKWLPEIGYIQSSTPPIVPLRGGGPTRPAAAPCRGGRAGGHAGGHAGVGRGQGTAGFLVLGTRRETSNTKGGPARTSA